jgi:hypothetical protein
LTKFDKNRPKRFQRQTQSLPPRFVQLAPERERSYKKPKKSQSAMAECKFVKPELEGNVLDLNEAK